MYVDAKMCSKYSASGIPLHCNSSIDLFPPFLLKAVSVLDKSITALWLTHTNSEYNIQTLLAHRKIIKFMSIHLVIQCAVWIVPIYNSIQSSCVQNFVFIYRRKPIHTHTSMHKNGRRQQQKKKKNNTYSGYG